MNKVININFQGSIIPIEESASEMLRAYIISLRQYFAQEEGRDEIISDIESRIAELFLLRIKKGAICITNKDLEEITAGIGHPADLEAAEAEMNATENTSYKGRNEHNEDPLVPPMNKRFSRSANNQIIAGVAAGIAHHYKIDPSIIRLLFVLSLFAGFGFLVYVILWAVLPQEQMADNAQKRLFRNGDEKKLGGVAAGLAAYFNVEIWIPRVVFLMPLILGGISSIISNSWFDLDIIPEFVFSGFGGTLFVIYFVLWAVLPEASTAAEKLQMRGEKVDLESIKKTVHSEMQNLKGKADGWSKEFGKRANEKAKMMGKDFNESMQQFSSQTNTNIKNSGSGLGHIIGVLAKVFVFSILGIITLSLLLALVSIIGAAIAGNNLREYVLEGETLNLLLWTTILLFFAVPVIGMLMWLIRALRGVKSRNKYVGYIFTMLWILGWVSLFSFVTLLAKNFSSKATTDQYTTLATPTTNKLYVKVDAYEDEDFILDWRSAGTWPTMNKQEDSIYSGNIRVKVVQSKDSLYHLKTVFVASGKTYPDAQKNAAAIQYNTFQQDSILHLNKYLTILRKEKFHNQQVLLVLEVPLGKKVELDETVNHFDWHDISVNTGNGFNLNVRSDDHDRDRNWDSSSEYIMLADGLKETDTTATKD